MKEMIMNVMKAKGIQVPEGDYEFLTGQWEGLMELKRAVTEDIEGAEDIALRHIPVGGIEHE
ncbi:hypothetical protein [Ferviditalea candida]|uniref:Uncharacterized protein n=1 Tax=Ferviditalea candida TaxID=3108399 RepID=A0ABU5ZHQ2_9BACL|nr:hypothetical protein [Paenibacillaceae bacterium T2]